ncbi:MAG: hypothetical protein GF364_07045 [Candidatus Lokiarchaeota archaeon]|nr:hypothetical protein [Candidatus Lokiarchaeota archaeon]
MTDIDLSLKRKMYLDNLNDNISVFDVHEHFSNPLNFIHKRPLLNEILKRSYVGDFDFYPGLVSSNCDPIDETPLPTDLSSLPRILKNAYDKRAQDYIPAFFKGIKAIYGIDLEQNLSLTSINRLEQELINRYKDLPEKLSVISHFFDSLSQIGNIRHVILDIPHCNYGFDFSNCLLDKSRTQRGAHKLTDDDIEFHVSLRINSLLYGFNKEIWNQDTFLPGFLKNKGLVETIPDNFDDYLAMIDKMLEWSKNKIVSYKCASAYERTINFGSAEVLKDLRYSKLNTLFRLPAKDLKRSEVLEFGNYIMHYLLKNMIQIQKSSIPIQMHTGMAIRSGSHPNNLLSLIKRYKEIDFHLLHCGYPWIEEMIDILKNHKNCIGEMVWLPQLSVETTIKFIILSVKNKLTDRIIGFGGDSGCVEGAIGALETLKGCLIEAFSTIKNKNPLANEEISKFSRQILSLNAIKSYLKNLS